MEVQMGTDSKRSKMALRVSAELCSGGSYLCGEKLHCRVHFTNESTSDDQVVAWCGAQLLCQCTFRENLVSPPSPPSGGLPKTQTAFLPSRGEKGFTALSTNPVVLCCDLKLKSGECQSFDFSEAVPLYCVPSFAGRLVRYTWKLSIGASRGLNADAKIIRIPFQVMTVPESILTHLTPTESPHLMTNPFLQHAKQEHPQHRDVILQGLAHQTSRRAPSTYELKTEQGVIGRMQLFKSVYRLGEEIIGTLDLSKASVPCLQVRVVLEAVEEVSEGHFCGSDKNLRVVASTYTQDNQCCSFALQKHFTVPIPSHVTHTFQSELVSYSWQLRFEFVTGQDRASLGRVVPSPSGSHQEWKGGKVVPCRMSLTLPITILSTDPAQVESKYTTKQVIEI